MKFIQVKSFPEITANIHGLSHDGRGITTLDDKICFINGAITGEKVICKLTKKHSRYNEGDVVSILIPAAERVTPACAHFEKCGGCSMQHLSMAAQIELKQKTFLEHLKHFGNVTPETILPPLSGNNWEYRHKARLGVRYVRKKEKLFVGFREKFSNFLADIHRCLVLHPSVGLHLSSLSELIASLTQYEHIPQIEVAVGDHATALVFRHLTALPAEDIAKLCAFGESHQFHIYLQPNSPATLHKIWPQDKNERLSYSLPAYQLTLQFHPLDFTQVNTEINQRMVQYALDLLDLKPTDTVLDLFCGIGNFTLPIAQQVHQVIGVEGNPETVARAKENARYNHINNVEFFTANLVQPPQSAHWLQQTYDKILLDPPRMGAQEIISFFPRFAANKIVYVSCNSATLARDAKELVHRHQYKLKFAGIINMFPHTTHVETIALFEK